jgi:hypothetical protein
MKPRGCAISAAAMPLGLIGAVLLAAYLTGATR